MYGDFLVPNNTNVNNAITTGTGAKWEKIETLEISDGEIIVYDEDIDGTLLNVNGIKLVCNIVSSGNTGVTMTAKDNTICFYATQAISVNSPYMIFTVTDDHGLMRIDRITASGLQRYNTAIQSSNVIHNFEHDYFKLAVIPATGVTISGTIDVYFLRSV